MFAILAKQKAHVLPFYLDCLLKQTFPLSHVHLYIRANDSTDETEAILQKFVQAHAASFASVFVDMSNISAELSKFGQHEWNTTRFRILGKIRQESVNYAMKLNAHYFVADCDNFISPTVLQEMYNLRSLNSVVAPMLRSATMYSNFHNKVTETGYFHQSDMYQHIYNQQIQGLIEVPVVHCTYFIPNPILPYVSYDDSSARFEYVIFSDTLRKNSISQILDNRRWYGYVSFKENLADLICEFHTHFQDKFTYKFKTIIVSPTTSVLGNRLRALCSALVFADTYGYIVEFADDTFATFFQPHPRITKSSGKAVDIAYSEWLPHHGWFKFQSTGITAHGVPHDKIVHASAEALIHNTHSTILLETSLAYFATKHETYKKYFVPKPDFFVYEPNFPDTTIAVMANLDAQFLMYFPEAQNLEKRFIDICTTIKSENVLVYSNNADFQTKMQIACTKSIVCPDTIPTALIKEFVVFLSASKCARIYSSPCWSLPEEAAIFGDTILVKASQVC